MKVPAPAQRSWRLPLLLATIALTLCSASILSPDAFATGSFVKLGAEMTEERYAPAVGTLPDGKVLVSGGYGEGVPALTTAELFDPATNTFAKLAAAPTGERGEACYATLADGRVLIAGGTDHAASLKTAEVFDPKTETFEEVGEMAVERDGCAAATLPGGKVLIVDGVGSNGASNYKQAELFDPATNSFESNPAETSSELYEPAAVSLPDGKVLVAGGFEGGSSKETAAAELFDPATSKFEATSHQLVEAREELAYLPAFGGALLLGGSGSSPLSSVELFSEGPGSFEKVTNELTEAREGGAAARLQNGSVLVLGGFRSPTNLRTAEIAPRTLLATTAASTAPGTLGGTAVAEIPASAYFQYGTSTSYGSSTSAQALTPSPVATAVGATLPGLLPGTTYHYRLVAEDAGGPVYGADETFTTAAPPVIPILHPVEPIPLISRAGESHGRWREGNKLASISSHRKRPPVGTTFSFTLNEKATVSLTFSQRVSGRKAKGKCLAQTKANKHKRSCSRSAIAGTHTFAGHAGADKISFQGRISSSKKLKPGTYTLTIIAINATGKHSASRQLTFTIVR